MLYPSPVVSIQIPPPSLSIIVYVTQERERERSLFCRFLCCWRSGVTGIIQRRGPFIANSQRGRRDSRAFFWRGEGWGTPASNCSMMTLLHGRLTQSEYYAVQQRRMLYYTRQKKKWELRASRELGYLVWRLTSCYNLYRTAVYITSRKRPTENQEEKKIWISNERTVDTSSQKLKIGEIYW